MDLISSVPAAVAIVDDDSALCELLRYRLDDEPGLTCVGVATTPDDARTLIRGSCPTIVIVDVGLGAGVDAIDLVGELVAASPSSQVLIWTKWTDPSVERIEEMRRKLRARRNGATDWIAKSEGIDHLVEHIREAVRRGPPDRHNGAPVSPIDALLNELVGSSTAAAPRAIDGAAGLTPAERRAVETTAWGLERGMTVEQIANALRLKPQTLRTHLRNIYVKWQVHSQPEFIAEARRRGLL